MKYTITLLLLFTGVNGFCCTTCNKQLQEQIYNSTFFPNLFTMLSAFIVLAVIVAVLSYLSSGRHKKYLAANPATNLLNPAPLTTAAMVLGIGTGGFIDGIVLHQILQWHEMLTNKIPPDTVVAKSVNMFWDGVFHAFTLVVVFIGIVLLFKLLHRNNINRSGKLLAGGMLTGWGLFNIVEGVINHHILELHHVRETGNHDLWNYGFLVFSVVLIVVGWWLTKQGNNKVTLNTAH